MSDMPPPPPPPGPPAPPPPPSGPPVPTGGGRPSGAPQDYFVLAIVSTILGFCLSCVGVITGIVAIVYSSQARKAVAVGDMAAAAKAANTAKIFVIISFALAGLGLLVNIIQFAAGSSPFFNR